MLRPLLGTGLFLLLAASRVPALTDPFDQDPTTNPDWEYYSPTGAGTTSTDDGLFRVTIPRQP